MHQIRQLLILMMVLNSIMLSGCVWSRGWMNFSGPAPCKLRPDLPLPELVQHLNQNSSRLTGWRTTSARISSPGMPVSLSAMLAVEAPRNFRLVVTGAVGGSPEVDLGSNQDMFWFWTKRSEQKYIFTARHDQLAKAQQRFPIPFQPDWVIEALGVIPIDESEVTLERDQTGLPRASLISQRLSPQGEPVRKVTIVDTCHGLILEHVLFDPAGQMLARATLSGHHPDPVTGAILPSRVELEWPPARLRMSMTLGAIEVNPRVPPSTWAVPKIRDCPILDLGR